LSTLPDRNQTKSAYLQEFILKSPKHDTIKTYNDLEDRKLSNDVNMKIWQKMKNQEVTPEYRRKLSKRNSGFFMPQITTNDSVFATYLRSFNKKEI